MRYLRLGALFAVLLFIVFYLRAGAGEHEDLQKARGAMRNLSKTMQACYRFEDPPAGLQDRELMEYCTRHNPDLREFYENFTVRFKFDRGYAVVLVCSQDGGRWLMEDLSCTGVMDSPPLDNEPERPCEFSLSAGVVCPQLSAQE
jgi:hypothetical protein